MGSVIAHPPSLTNLDEANRIMEALPDGLLMTDVLGRITFANERMEQMSGYAWVELVGMSVELLVPERFHAMHEHQRERFRTEPRTRSMATGLDTRLLRRDGSELPVQIQLTPAEIGGERGVLAAVRDIRDRTEAERLRIERHEVLSLIADRERIAVEANAGVIHTLFGIGLHLQAAVQDATGTSRKAMERAIAEIDQAITEVREHVFRHRSGESPV